MLAGVLEYLPFATTFTLWHDCVHGKKGRQKWGDFSLQAKTGHKRMKEIDLFLGGSQFTLK